MRNKSYPIRERKNIGVHLIFITTLSMFALFSSLGYSLQSYEVSTESYQLTNTDGREQFIWIGNVTNNTVEPVSGIEITILVRSETGNLILKGIAEDISLKRFETRKIEYLYPYPINLIAVVEDVEALDVNVEITKPSQGSGWYETSGNDNNYKSNTARSNADAREKANNDRSDQRCRDARSALTRLADSYQMKYEVYQLCPPSYMTSSKCGKLSQQLTDLREDLDRAKRKAKSACR